jgi:hypothetical protein
MPKVIINGRGDEAVDDVDVKAIWYTLGLDDEYLELHVNCTHEGLIFDIINVDGDVIDTLCHTVSEYVVQRLEEDLAQQRSELLDDDKLKVSVTIPWRTLNTANVPVNKTFNFNTRAEAEAFRRGIEAADQRLLENVAGK